MNRLTDHKTAEALRNNAEGLSAKGIDVPIDDLRYIKLAGYEDEEERKKRTCMNVEGGLTMTDTDMLYMASLQKRNEELEAKIAELEDKHWNECGQIANYDDELREYTREHTERVWVMKSDVLDLITEAYKDSGFKDYSDYDRLWGAVDNM